MWVMLTDCFLSIVKKDCALDELLVRARRPRDIAKVFPGAKVKRSAGTDYRYRAVVPAEEVAAVLASEAHRIDYDNFKDAFVAALPPDAELVLAREPDNKFDKNAVAVWAKDANNWRHVGYISKDQNAVLAQFIDAMGKPWIAPRPVMALDAPSPESVQIFRAVDARLHKGSNTWPLVEIA